MANMQTTETHGTICATGPALLTQTANAANLWRRLTVWMLAAVALTCVGCVDEDEFDNNPRGNFEALWKIMDEHYCFFDEKGVDWNAIYQKYSPRVDEGMTNEQLFEVLTQMVGELKDGHVNLFSAFDVGRNWSWEENYPTNFSDTLQRKYLSTDYRIATGMQYRILDDNIGYIYCGSFSNSLGAGNLDEIFMYLAPCNGLIMDIRSNSGGQMTSAVELAARFTNKTISVGYMQHKNGKGHNDFSAMQEQLLKPSNGIRWQKRVVLLTNRGVYSAANEFTQYMHCCPNVTIVGDHTGGGGGMPFNSELPNGWSVRFSACPTFDTQKQSIEGGIDPDHFVAITDDDLQKGKDTIIEFARQLLNSQ